MQSANRAKVREQLEAFNEIYQQRVVPKEIKTAVSRIPPNTKEIAPAICIDDRAPMTGTAILGEPGPSRIPKILRVDSLPRVEEEHPRVPVIIENMTFNERSKSAASNWSVGSESNYHWSLQDQLSEHNVKKATTLGKTLSHFLAWL